MTSTKISHNKALHYEESATFCGW